MDEAALAGLGDQQTDWRFKGFPASTDGTTVAQLVAAKPRLADFSTPLLVLDSAALEHNLATMAGYCAEHGVDLAPHGKTTMAPQLFARQLAAGAWGITVASIAQARVCRAFGVPTILLANELVDSDALAWIADQSRRDPGFRFLCFADSVAAVALMQAALATVDAPRPVDVLIDLGAPGGRTGCRDLEEATSVALAVHASDRLALVGVAGYEGVLAGDRSAASLDRVRGYLGTMRELAILLDERGLFADRDEIVVTAGGSAYFDDVVEILGGPWATSRPVRTVLRSGAYISHDDGHYRTLTPFQPNQPGPGPFRAALHIRGRELSLPEPGLALLDFGKRDAPLDLGLPEPHEIQHADGRRSTAEGYRITALADQHAFLNSDPSQGAAAPLFIGDVVVCGISHPCTAFDKWQLIPVVEDGHVIDLIRTFF